MDNDNISEVLRLLRIANDLTIKEMATKLEVTPPYISNIERGKKKPSESILNKYSKILNVDMKGITFFIEENNKSEKSEKGFSFQKLLLKILEKIAEG